MSRRREISLIIGLLLIACLAQAAIAGPDGTGNETGGQVANTTTPVPTAAPDVTVNAAGAPVGADVSPTPVVTPDVTATVTVEPTVTPVTTTATPAPEVTVVATIEPTVVAVTPVSTPVPDVTVIATVQPDVTTIAPAATPAPNTTIQVPADQPDANLAPASAGFRHYLDMKTLSQVAMVKQGHGLGYVPPPIDFSQLKGQKVSWTAVEAEAEATGTDLATEDTASTGYPSSYDLRTLGKVTGVRDQGACGSCWAFAAYGSLESTLLPGETWDFSENNMINTNGYDLGHCAGGSDTMAMAYLARWSGPVNDKADPYSITSLVSPADLRIRKHAQGMFIIPPRTGSLDNANLKAAIMNYGGVYSLMDWEPEAYNAANASYYNGGAYWYDHAVTLVGWDDSFDRNKFALPSVNYDGTPSVIVPSDNGAFIAKNSWGTGFGQAGYFSISYDDPLIGMGNTVFTAEPLKNLKREYQYR